MAIYKSRFKGSQVDEAVTIANNNYSKGDSENPIFYNADGYGQAIEKDTIPTISSVKPLTSGGAYAGLSEVVNNSDVQNQNFVEGNFEKQCNPLIVDRIFYGDGYTSAHDTNYLVFSAPSFTNSSVIEVNLRLMSPSASVMFQGYVAFARNTWFGFDHHRTAFMMSNNGGSSPTVYTGTISLNTEYDVKIIIDTTYSGFRYKKATESSWSSLFKYNVRSNMSTTDWMIGNLWGAGQELKDGSMDLSKFEVYVDGKFAYSPYPQSDLPPSQAATKQYIDAEASTKQDQMYGGYGIDINGTTVSVDDSVLRKGQESLRDIKENHFDDMTTDNTLGMLKSMDEMNHSTFVGYQASDGTDSKKVRKYGNLITTYDGVASNFSIDSYLRFPAGAIICGENDAWEMEWVFKTGSFSNSYSQVLLNIFGSNAHTDGDASKSFGVYSQFDGGSGRELSLVFDGSGWAGNIAFRPSEGWKENTNFKLVMGQDSTKRYATLYNLDNDTSFYKSVLLSQLSSRVKTYWATENVLTVGKPINDNAPVYNTIDLKRFKFSVNGVVKYTCNETGIDIIKPNDWSVDVGSEYINVSDEGILSFSGRPARIQKANLLPSTVSDIEYYGSFIQYASGPIITSDWASFISFYNQGSQIDYHFTGEGNAQVGGTSILNYTIQLGKKYYIKAIFKNGNCLYGISEDNKSWVTATSTYTDTSFTPYYKHFKLGTANSLGDNQNTYDLNDFRIYLNGYLIYQPCLKIPYTLSKDNKKIVDARFRERVEDEYNQLGYTPYYTLSGDNFNRFGNVKINKEWVVNDFSNSNYLTCHAPFLTGSKYEIIFPKVRFDMGAYNHFQYPVSQGVNNNYGVALYWHGTTNAASLYCYFGSGNNFIFSNIGINGTDEFSFKMIISGTNVEFYSATNDGEWVQHSATATTGTIAAKNSFCPDFTFGRHISADDYYFKDSLDFSTFKIYVDDKLVYTAIPNYTLATVGANDIVDEYLNGSTSYTQRANLVLEQQGTCLEGSTVQFPKAFSNTDYALSIPYVAGSKTTTGFTAARAGDYFAEGSNTYTSIPLNKPLEVYEFIIDQSISDPSNAVSYVGANTGFIPAKMDYTNDIFDWGSWKDTFLYEAFRPCMLTYAGSVDYYLDPNDYTKKLDGTASDVADTTYGGNAMVEFDQIWIKEKNENGKFRISIANSQVDKDYDCWTHMRNDGTLNSHAYRSCYIGCNVDSVVRSISGQAPVDNVTGTSMINSAKANGSGWNIEEYSFRRLMQYLAILMGKTLDSQSAFGRGNVNNTVFVDSGTLDDKGLFYGSNSATSAVKLFGIENLWGDHYLWINGLVSKGSTLYYKMCEGTVDGSTVNEYNATAENYINSGVSVTGSGNNLATTNLVSHLGLVPYQITSSDFSLRYCDSVSLYNGTSTNSFPTRVNAWRESDKGAGIFALTTNGDFGSAWVGNSCAISYKAQPSS